MVLFGLTLVRHGETEENATMIIQGQTDVPLNETGRIQAGRLARALHNQPLFNRAYASDLKRASETAKILVEDSQANLPVRLDGRLRERNFGVLEKQPSALLREYARKNSVSPTEYTPENGETREELRSRVVNFFRDMCRQLEEEASLPAAPMSPGFSSGSLGIGGVSRHGSHRKISRGSALNVWPEESGEEAVNLGEFFLDTPSSEVSEPFEEPAEEGTGCSMETDKEECIATSLDSGIASSETPLTIDTTLRMSSSGSSSVSGLGLSAPTSPLPPRALASPGGFNGSRKVSTQSIASDDSYFPSLDFQVLVVTHGGPIRELMRFFCDELNCLIPGGKGAALRRCPNTGVSTFMVHCDGDGTTVTCLDIYSKEHLVGMSTATPVE